jgi:hypothetical protein
MRREKPPDLQLNLSLLNVQETARELALALVELLINATRENVEQQDEGGGDELRPPTRRPRPSLCGSVSPAPRCSCRCRPRY